MKTPSLKFAAKYLLKVAKQLQADKSVKAFLHEIEVKDVQTVSKIGTTMNKYWTITDGSGKRTVYNDFNKFKEKLMPALHSNQQHFDKLMKDLEKHAGDQKKQIDEAMKKNNEVSAPGFMEASLKEAMAERNDMNASVASRIADAFMADEPKPWGKGEWQSYKQEHPQTKVHPKFTPPQNQHKSPK